jgi:beta-lactamase regulating signal transducer with metallopeptidase domain
MIPALTIHASGMLLLLANAALRTLVLAAVAGLGLAVFRVKATSARLLTWTAFLYAALSLPLLLWLLPSILVPLPVLPPTAVLPASSGIVAASIAHPAGNQEPQKQSLAGRGRLSPEFAAGIPSSVSQKPAKQGIDPWSGSLSWTFIAAAIYLAVASILLARFLIGLAATRRLVKESQELTDRRLRSISSRSAWSDSSLFCVRESLAIAVPVTVGPIRSTVLLPSNWREWDDERLDAVMTHELSHVFRRDPTTHCIGLLYRAIFWFSPLSWWLQAHIAELAEQASDEAALSGGADRNRYARTLLAFFETLHAAPQRVWWQGVSMAHAGQAEKRLEKILGWKGSVAMHLKKSAVILIIALTVPVVYLAAAVRPTASSPAAIRVQQPPQPVATLPAPPAPPPTEGVTAVAPIAGVPAHGPIAGVPAPPAPPLRGVAAVPPVPAPPAPTQNSTFATGHNHGSWYSYGFDDDERFVIVTGKSDSFTMSGSSQDAHHVQKLRKQIPGDFIWFQRDEKSYIIRDQATIDRAHKLWAPQEELGKKQEELGRQQEALGKQQEELGAKMEQVKVNVPDMTAAIDHLKAKLQKLGPTATMEQVGELQSEIGELQSKIGDLQSHAGDQQGKLGEEMGALGEKQGKLGAQQGELGRQQGELAEKASKEMKQLLDDAIKNGKAQPEPEVSEAGSL